MNDQLNQTEAADGQSRLTAVLDAARYRRLAALVGFGMWSVTRHEVIDRMGATKDTSIDDKADMDEWLDRPDVVQEADTCAKCLGMMASNIEVSRGAPTPAKTNDA